MDKPRCFIPKCRMCEWFEMCANSIKEPLMPTSETTKLWHKPIIKAQVQPKEKRKLRTGKKIKDMSIEEKRAYWREQAAIKRKRLLDEKQNLTPTGKKVMKGLQRNADKLKEIKKEFPNEVSERP